MPYYSRRYLQEPGRKWILLYMFIPVLLVACLIKKLELIVENNFNQKCSFVCSSHINESLKEDCILGCLETFYKKNK